MMAEQYGFLSMEMERHQRLLRYAAGAALTMLRGWRVSAMENGECNRASPSRQQGTLGEPMFYLRVGGTMQQWRQWRKKEIGRSISLRGSDA